MFTICTAAILQVITALPAVRSSDVEGTRRAGHHIGREGRRSAIPHTVQRDTSDIKITVTCYTSMVMSIIIVTVITQFTCRIKRWSLIITQFTYMWKQFGLTAARFIHRIKQVLFNHCTVQLQDQKLQFNHLHSTITGAKDSV